MSGPIAPNTFEPPSLPKTSLAATVPAPILIISFLFVLKAADNVSNPPFKFPPIICCAAVPALAASKNARPAPVSNKLIENDRFLRGDLFLPRLTSIFDSCGGVAYGHPASDTAVYLFILQHSVIMLLYYRF